MSLDFVRRLPLFGSLPEADLARLIDMAEPVHLDGGAFLMKEGESGGSLYIVVDGDFDILKRSGDQDVAIAVRGAGEVLGEMSLLDNAPHSATVRARRPSHLLRIGQDAFRDLLGSSSAAALAILHTVTSRLRNTEAMLRQSEKMASLGTLSAGLAHELNNPAAAARRSADQLADTLLDWVSGTQELLALPLPETERGTLVAKVQTWGAKSPPPWLDPLARSDREQELQTWLDGQGLAESWEIAPILVEAGVERASLEEVLSGKSADVSAAILRWAANWFAATQLLREVVQSAERISEIVRAVKAYSYLDQAPVQNVDIHQGLEETLVILRHKLKDGVVVDRQYAPELPRIEAYGSELNQVWTNILDNAIDAMGGKGRIQIQTHPSDGHIVVEITDNGPGIPDAIQARIFDPFFTTKAPGVGTGLGLHISYNIVVQKHQGQIRVESRPGQTRFLVTLPVRLEKPA